MNWLNRIIMNQIKDAIREYIPPAGIMYITIYNGNTLSGIQNPSPKINGSTGIGYYSTEWREFKLYDIQEENSMQLKIFGDWIDKKYIYLYKDVEKINKFKLSIMKQFKGEIE